MRVLVADDHPLYREAVGLQVRRIYADAVVRDFPSLESLRGALAAEGACDLILVDFHMPGMSEQALAGLIREHPAIPLAVISGTARAADIRAAIKAGARAFIPKTAAPDYFAHTLQILLAGGTSVPADLLFDLLPAGAAEWLAALSPREREVLQGVSAGKPNKQIGRELGLAEVTVKLHLRNLFRKMGVKTRSEAAVMAVKAGLG